MSSTKIYTWWWSNKYIENLPFENFGDILAKYLVEKLSGKEAVYIDPRTQRWYDLRKVNIVTGSVIRFATWKCNVWGAGIIRRNEHIMRTNIFAVRGPLTLRRLGELGIKVSPAMGDPALLLPRVFNPEQTKKYKVGIIPHYIDIENFEERFQENDEVCVIDMRCGIEDVISKINSCEKTISSSLHGLIVSHAYNIPSVRVETENKIVGDGVKYDDYFGSVNIESYNPFILDDVESDIMNLSFWEKHQKKATINKSLDRINDELLAACPFI